jgi:hypothetical protein
MELVLKAIWTIRGRAVACQMHWTTVPAAAIARACGRAKLAIATRIKRKLTDSVTVTIGNRTFTPDVRIVITRKNQKNNG